MKRLLFVVPMLFVASAARAAEGLVILDVMPGGMYHSMVEYLITFGRAVGKFLGVL